MIRISKTHKVVTIILCVWATILALVAGCFGGFNMVYASTHVRGWSMQPSLNSNVEDDVLGDRVYYKRFSRRFSYGDIVIINVTNNPKFVHNGGEGDYIIKRVVGLEGDTVNIRYDDAEREYKVIVYSEGEPDGRVIYTRPHVQGGYTTYAQFEAYIKDPENASQVTSRGVKVGKGEVYVLGDNWNGSKDSSAVGTLQVKNVAGKVDIVVPKGDNAFVEIIKYIFK